MKVTWQLVSDQFAYTGETASWLLTVLNDSKVSETVSISLPAPYTLRDLDYLPGSAVYNGAGSASGDNHNLGEGGSVTIPVSVTVPDEDSYEATAVVHVTILRSETLSLGDSTVTLRDEVIKVSADTLRINTHRQVDAADRNDLMLLQEWMLEEQDISDSLASGKRFSEYVSQFDDDSQTDINTAAIALNTAKTGITAGQASEITANTAKVTYDDAATVAANTAAIAAKPETFAALTDTDVTGVSDQDQLKWDGAAGDWVAFTPISGSGSNLSWTAGTSTVASDTGTNAVLSAVDATNPGLATPQMLTDISANTAKTGITAGQASEITANTAKISYTDSAQVSTNTSNIATNASGVSTNATTVFNLGTDVSGHHTRLAGIDSDQVSQNSAIAANTAKTGITSGQASEITANTAKISYSDAALVATHTTDIGTNATDIGTNATAIALNTAKTGITAGQASEITANTAKVSYTDSAAVALNTAKISYTDAAAVAANTAKVSYTDAALVATHTTDIGTNTTKLAGIEAGADVTDSANVEAAVAGVGTDSVVIGPSASAAGNYSAALGSNSSAAGQQAISIGYLSNAAGYISVALGRNTSSTGNYDISMGYASSSTGGQGIAIGRQASATAANATAVGYLAEATASGAVAIGTSVVAATADTVSVNNLEVQGSMNVVGGFHPAGTRTGANRTLVPADANRTTMFSNAALVTVTIPLNSAEPFAIGAQFAIHSTGAGGVTLSTTGITINGSSPNTTIAQNEIMVLEKTGTDTWSVYGGTSA